MFRASAHHLCDRCGAAIAGVPHYEENRPAEDVSLLEALKAIHEAAHPDDRVNWSYNPDGTIQFDLCTECGPLGDSAAPAVPGLRTGCDVLPCKAPTE
jgi:hypothetical protein